MSEATRSSIGDFFDLDPGYAFKSPDFIDVGVPVIKIKNIKAGHFSDHEFSYVSSKFLALRANKLAKPGDLLISMSGNRHDGSPDTWVGKIAPFQKTEPFLINQRVGALRRKAGAKIDLRFASFLLSSFPYQELFISIATSSGGQANLSPQQILSAPLSPPPLETQIAIGEALGSLDDKIDLNRRMNETLEAMARAIFEDWFIDFGPTRAKMEGRARYLSLDIWALFPHRLDDEGKPEGWGACDLSDLVELNPSERLPKGMLVPYIDMASLPVRGSWPDGPVLREAGSGARFRNGDTLFARITPCLENGKTAYVTCLRDGEVAWGSTEFIVIRSRPPVPPEFAYLLARDESFRAHAIRSMTGTSGRQRVQPEALRTFGMVRASDDLLRAFGALVSAKFQKIASNAKECETLTATRDLLLPKLMSGEIRVRQAEKAVA